MENLPYLYLLIGAICTVHSVDGKNGFNMGKAWSIHRIACTLVILFAWPGYVIDRLTTAQVKKIRKSNEGPGNSNRRNR